MASKTRAKYGYLSYNDIADRIESGKLDAYDVVFTTDTKEIVVITPELSTFSVRSRVYVFDTVADAETALNQQSETYAGQLVAILQGDVYRGYIVNRLNDTFLVTPLWEQPDKIDYNTLGNRPIINMVGTLDSPILLSVLEGGIYSVVGQYKIADTEETVYLSAAPTLVLVEHEQDGRTFVKRITAHEIKDSIIENGVVSSASYVTEEYLKNQSYVTTADMDKKLAALDFVQKKDAEQYISEMVSNVLEEKLDDTINERINECIDEKMQPVQSDAILSLFSVK